MTQSAVDIQPPEPGTEYPFAVSDIARAVALVLGDGWGSESGHWGTTGQVHTPEGVTITIGIDMGGDPFTHGDLYLDSPTGRVYPPDVEDAPRRTWELTELAEQLAPLVRDIASGLPTK